MICGVGRKCSSDPMVLWLRVGRQLQCRQAVAVPIQPLAWELLSAVGLIPGLDHWVKDLMLPRAVV